MDHILVYGAPMQDHNIKLRNILTRLKSAAITLNKDKCSIGQTSVIFVGQQTDQQAIKPEPCKIEAIEKFQRPSSVTEFRRFLGLVNYLVFQWDSVQNATFEKEELLTSHPILIPFNPKFRTIVSADTSSFVIYRCRFAAG